MTDDDPVNGPTLAQLIKNVMTREKLSNQNVLVQAGKRDLWDLTLPKLNWLKKAELKEYPKPPTIEALAAGLGVTYDQVLNACTRSMGRPHLWRPDNDGATVIVDDAISADTARQYGARVRRAAHSKDHSE